MNTCHEITTPPHPTYSEQINEIMDNFDFGNVAKAMNALEWKWSSTVGNDNEGVPTEPEIRQHARRMMNDVFSRNVLSQRCGGFVVDHEAGFLTLSFELESYTCNKE